ncbi:PqqD family peptide modification chaperone [Sedimentibacter sp. MB31-C6]|uniref:PqqD family peptide modification chaperone n=1 Tax=Sedimentibacter sp. MB31-C6 TaxID=3109366 RepID=UPI002DDDAB3E|nr:PqqD family peptide modification chaperone [Sedimentibacter sp. MB36-C1]WSI04217.1 PqqD family peptide modification chaperone [Sedimentibacter sp. MB36-C1]
MMKNQEVFYKDIDTKHNFALFVPEIKLNDWKEEDGKVVLCLKTIDPIKKFLAWMVNRKSITNLNLDERCSTVWKYIDGERTIYDIAKLMSEKYKEDVNNEMYRLITYLKYLSKRGWIKFKEYEV